MIKKKGDTKESGEIEKMVLLQWKMERVKNKKAFNVETKQMFEDLRGVKSVQWFKLPVCFTASIYILVKCVWYVMLAFHF